MKLMRKSISAIVALAIILTMCCVTAFAATTAGPVSIMPTAAATGTTFTDGVLVFEGAAGATASYDTNISFNLNNCPKWFVDLTSTGKFEITLTMSDGKAVGLAADFCYDLGEGNGTDGIKAGTYQAAAGFIGAYTWNNSVPADGMVTLKKVAIKLVDAGKLTIRDMYMNDVTKPASTTKVAGNLLTDPAESWSFAAGGDGTSVAAAKAADGTLTLTNAGGGWPAGKVSFATPISVTPATDVLSYNIQAEGEASILIFFNGDTPDSYAKNNYVKINHLIKTDLDADKDLPAGRYSGTIKFSDILPAAMIAKDGTATITGLKAFVIGNAGQKTILRKMVVLTPKSNFTVSFDSKGGSTVEKKTVLEGEAVAAPTNPTKDGSTFEYWYTTDANTAYDFAKPVVANLTLNAKWKTNTTQTSQDDSKDEKPVVYEKTSLISMNPADWTAIKADDSTIAFGKDSNGNLMLQNQGGKWPAGAYIPKKGITVQIAKSKLSFDLTVGGTTSIILFLNGATPESYADGQYVVVNKNISAADLAKDESGDLVGSGKSFKGMVDFSAIKFPAGTVKDGKVTISGIKIFNVGETKTLITLRELAVATPKADSSAKPGTETAPNTGAGSFLPAALLLLASGAVLVISKKK